MLNMERAATSMSGLLSISSLASADRLDASDNDSIYSQTDMYEHLRSMNEVAYNFYSKRPTQLNTEQNTFAELGFGDYQEFEFSLNSLGVDDVVAITVTCILNSRMEDEDFLLKDRRKVVGKDFQALTFDLTQVLSKQALPSNNNYHNIQFKPTLFNGEYCIALSKAHGLKTGKYILAIHNDTSNNDGLHDLECTQTVKINFKQCKSAKAKVIEANKPLISTVSSNCYQYYRYTLTNPEALLSITVQPLYHSNGEALGDPDLFVTNRFDGLVGVSDCGFVWSSTHVGADRIDIHADDVNLARNHLVTNIVATVGAGARTATITTGMTTAPSSSDVDAVQTFLIGVLGCKEHNEFEILVTTSAPPLVIPLQLHTDDFYSKPIRYDNNTTSSTSANNPNNISSINIQLEYKQAQYFSLDIEPTFTNNIILLITYQSAILVHNHQHNRSIIAFANEIIHTPGMLTQWNYGVASTDSLAVFTNLLSNSNRQGLRNHSLLEEEHHFSTNVGTKPKVVPVVYMSATNKFPSESNHTWRASSIDGVTVVVINPAEWKYTTGTCYLTLHGLELEASNLLDTSHASNSSVGSSDLSHHALHETSNGDATGSSTMVLSNQVVLNVFQQPAFYHKSVSNTINTSTIHNMNHTSNTSNATYDTNFDVNQRMELRRLLFNTLYSRVDGSLLSHQDRAFFKFENTGTNNSNTNQNASKNHKHYNTIKNLLQPNQNNYYTYHEADFTYTETEFYSVLDILQQSGVVDGQILYDLGSGVGKFILGAALSPIKFQRCIGVEVLPSLHDCSVAAVNGLVAFQDSKYFYRDSSDDSASSNSRNRRQKRSNSPKQPKKSKSIHTSTARDAASDDLFKNLPHAEKFKSLDHAIPLLEMRCENILNSNWFDGDVIFVTALCFSPILHNLILELSKKLSAGAKLVTVHCPDNYQDSFELQKVFSVKMEWGNTRFYVLLRKDKQCALK